MTDGPARGDSMLREWTKALLIAITIWLFLRSFLVEAFRIPSGSMENTLLVGDFLFVNKALYGAEVPLSHRHLPAVREPRRGELVIFDSVEEPGRTLVKRLVGLPGDTLAMRHGTLFRDGGEVDEPYAVNVDPDRSESLDNRERMRAWQLPYFVGPSPRSYQPDLNDWGPLVVPPDSLFVLGDNRDGSYDGRYWGFVPRGNVEGRPILIYFSYEPDSWKALPFFTRVRWARIFSLPE